MKQEQGITLITLVITIIVLLILAGTVTYSGIQAIQTSKKTAFISELEMIQAKVNTIYEKRKLNEQDVVYYNALGQDISVVETGKLTEILQGKQANGFRYFSREDLKQLDLENIAQDVIINLTTREVISVTGIEIEGIWYYQLENLPGYIGKNISHIDKNTQAPNFTVEVTALTNRWRFTIKNIEYRSNVQGGTVSYRLQGATNWIRNNENTSFEVTAPGIYDIQLTDRAGNSTIKQGYIYVTDGLVAMYDGENNTGVGHDNTATIWKDLSGNGKDAIYQGNSTTWQENNYYFTNSETNYFETSQVIELGAKDRTIEYVVSMDTTGSQNFFGLGTLETGKMLDIMFYHVTNEFTVHNYGNSSVGLPQGKSNTIYSNAWIYSNGSSYFRMNQEEKKKLPF